MTRAAFASIVSSAVSAVPSITAPAPALALVPALGTRLTLKGEKHNGIYEVIDFNNGKVRLNKVSADGSRLIKGKTFTTTASELAAIS